MQRAQDRLVERNISREGENSAQPKPDQVITPPPGYRMGYPTDYIMPYRFKHPVTGKETSEVTRNLAVFGNEIETLYK